MGSSQRFRAFSGWRKELNRQDAKDTKKTEEKSKVMESEEFSIQAFVFIILFSLAFFASLAV